ncbi:hypothetical protein EA458_02550 [Streptococcus dysgalactiae subsp. dysgalactiae]|nr:hypothetical protein EA458_02550 [Streptococcus dysgalactiae subsp. dysgalactiae]
MGNSSISDEHVFFVALHFTTRGLFPFLNWSRLFSPQRGFSITTGKYQFTREPFEYKIDL